MRCNMRTRTTWSGTIGGSVTLGYDNFMRVASEQINSAPASLFTYDDDGLLNSAGALNIMRDAATGFVSEMNLGNVKEVRTYNEYGEDKTLAVIVNGSTTLYSVDYGERDPLGRIASKAETVQGITHTYTYVYDAVGRLTDVANDSAPTSHYEYDANGARTLAPGFTASPAYDAQDRLLSYGNCPSYTYKPDGSLRTKTCSGTVTVYDYDALGNLRHVNLPDGTTIDYIIDGQNRRIGKKVNGLLVEGFLYRNQLQPAAWLNADGSTRATFVYGLRPNVPAYGAGRCHVPLHHRPGRQRPARREYCDRRGRRAHRLGRVRQCPRG